MKKDLGDFATDAHVNSIWNVPSVVEQPCIRLVRWSVMEISTGERFFVGYNVEDCEGRVSTAIQSFDPNTAKGITRSGRIYQLIGPPGFDPDADWVWKHMVDRSNIKWNNISEIFVQELATALKRL